MAAPVLSPANNSENMTEGGAGVLLFDDITVSDADSANLMVATVTISDLRPGDYLAFTDQNGITGFYDQAAGILVLTGVASVADYQAALRSIVFMHAGDANFNGSDNTRSISIQISDGLETSVAVTAQIGILDGGITASGDTLPGTPIDDVIDGLAGDDDISGGAGNDRLKGGLGDDTLRGGTGDDTYIVDSAGDVTDESGGDGVDLVWTTVSWTLAADLENLTLSSAGRAIDGTGNALRNVIIGNDAANTLSGADGDDDLVGAGGVDTLNGDAGADTLVGGNGNDLLFGGADDDMLIGGAHNDRLDGGAGADTLIGELGNDTYVVDDAGDIVVEAADEGIDTIETALSSFSLNGYTNVENLVLLGSASSGYGNSLNNVLTGNAQGNTLQSFAGDDTLYGMDGDDLLIGGAGVDKMYGGNGADTFLFESVAQMANDRIYDLSFAQGDIIDLVDVYGGTLAFATRFTGVAGQVVLTYNAAQGLTWVRIDTNGDKVVDGQFSITGDVTGTTGNLYENAGDTDGGWLL